jgi:hypothetical protein
LTHVVTLQRNFRQSDATGCARVASRIAGPVQTFAASSLFMARDADGDTITKIALWDTGTGGGHFVVNGVAQAPNVEIDVTAAAQSMPIGSLMTGISYGRRKCRYRDG